MSRRVLIVDATATNRIALKASLSAARYQVTAVANATEALAAFVRDGTDIVVCDVDLPDMTAQDFCARMRSDHGSSTPPIVVVSDRDDAEFRIAALEAGASSIVRRPIDRQWLLTTMRSLLRASESRAELHRRTQTASRLGFAEASSPFETPGRIAIVGEKSATASAIARELRRSAPHDISVISPSEAQAVADSDAPPDLFVLSHQEGDIDEVLWILAELRASGHARRAAFVVEYDPEMPDKGARALDLGVNDLVPCYASAEERSLRILRQLKLKRETDALRASVDAGLVMAAFDPLTGLYNRRYAMHHLAVLAARPHAAGRGYGTLLVDVDHFKAVNDTFGHPAGDAVLRQVADRLRENIRDVDLVARIGGEEFLIAMPDTAPDEAMIAAERLRTAISATPITTTSGTDIAVTVSIGAVCAISDPDSALASADAALYRAKAEGRDRTRLADDARDRLRGPRGLVDYPLAPPAERTN
ncbi:two-component system cell cycle response regulator [Palleronia aestuarii]|uniref:diguanylate cyclase n=1 Tax=Palleronia aestuarii TaxID=568105 RepID=A0A2W7N8C8_9RHOB|nr:diguanylate cyclase [Palleronia aestuarii]PZX16338.1 two-component system cell cycle response regulator [Palleronia aestuarii]